MTTADESGQGSVGFAESVRRLGKSLLDLLHTRTELFTVELQEEKVRVLKLVLWVAAAITVGVSGLLIAMGALALCVWEAAGSWGLVGLAAGALGAAALILWGVHRNITNSPAPFAGTVAEFKKDAACLRQPQQAT
jgi:uncharacterized membrane protein YqjE